VGKGISADGDEVAAIEAAELVFGLGAAFFFEESGGDAGAVVGGNGVALPGVAAVGPGVVEEAAAKAGGAEGENVAARGGSSVERRVRNSSTRAASPSISRVTPCVEFRTKPVRSRERARR
jgi:hypothetical protein